MRRLAIFTFLLCLLCGCVEEYGQDQHIIGFYNLENLFDIYDDPQKNDEDFLPDGRNEWTEERYRKKLANMAEVINEMAIENGMWHTVLGVCEVENIQVLEDLVAHETIKDAGFKAILNEGPDGRGIDVGLIYRPSQFKILETESIPYTFEDSSIDFKMSKKDRKKFRTRDILMVRGLIGGELFAFYVAHLPSRGGDKPGGYQLRDRGAEIMYNHAMELMEKYPGIKIVCMGDMNDNPTDSSMAEYLHGEENAKDVDEDDFFSPYVSMLKAGFGSQEYRGVWNIYDLQLVNHALSYAPEGGLRILDHDGDGYYGNIFKRPFLTNPKGKYKGTPLRTFSGGKFAGGYSDHYPTYIVIGKSN